MAEDKTALDRFIRQCDERYAAEVRWRVERAEGRGYDAFSSEEFDVEVFHLEDRVTIVHDLPMGLEDVEISIKEFLAALPDVPAVEPAPKKPRRAFITPPPGE